MMILDTTLTCCDCMKPLPYNFAVLIDVTLMEREDGLEHICILCHDCEIKEGTE